MSNDNVVGINVHEVPSVRVFDAATGAEESTQWDKSSLLKFASQVRSESFTDGQVVHFCSYRKIHRVIRNFDRNEIHIYWNHLVGYDPVKEFKDSL